MHDFSTADELGSVARYGAQGCGRFLWTVDCGITFGLGKTVAPPRRIGVLNALSDVSG